VTISSHESRVGAHKARQWACPRVISVVYVLDVIEFEVSTIFKKTEDKDISCSFIRERYSMSLREIVIEAGSSVHTHYVPKKKCAAAYRAPRT
jgi:hypothetical protein